MERWRTRLNTSPIRSMLPPGVLSGLASKRVVRTVVSHLKTPLRPLPTDIESAHHGGHSGTGMKRSRTASLVVMGLTPLFLGACDDTQKSQQMFTTLDNCAEGGVPASVCQQAYSEASAQAPRMAPGFASRELCAQQYDNDTCESVDNYDGTSTWHPAMHGFLIGRVVRNQVTSFYPAGPIFHKRDDSYYATTYGHVYSEGAGGWRSTSSSEAVGE